MTDFRALCAELHAAVQLYTGQNPFAADMPTNEVVFRLMDAMSATAAALAQPELLGKSCPGCEGAPAASNSPCAVCGQLAQPEPQEPPEKCWLDDEPELYPSPSVLDLLLENND
jgi:hypothetical protein